MLTEVGNTERLRNLRSSIEDSFKRLEQRLAGLETESAKANARLEEVTAEQALLAGEIDRDDARLAELGAAISTQGSEMASLRAQEAGLRTDYDAVCSERAAAEHRLRSLEDLDAHRAYYSDAVQQVLDPAHAASINARGTLVDFVQVEPQYEQLVESLFSRELQCVLVPTIDDALAGVEYIKAEGLGRGAFLVVGLHGGEEDPDRGEEKTPEGRDIDIGHDNDIFFESGDRIPIERQLNPADPAVPDYMFEPSRPVSWPLAENRPAETPPKFELDVLRAIDLLGLRPEIKSVVERAFPDKCAASVVPDIEAALQLSIENNARIYVTADGEQVVNGRLIVTGGQAGTRGTSLLGLKREIKDLRERVAAYAARIDAMEADCAASRTGVAAAEAVAAALDNQHREHEKESAARRSRSQLLVHESERAGQHVRVVASEQEQLAAERSELEEKITRVISDLAAAEALQESVRVALGNSQATLGEMRARLEQLAEELAVSRESVAALTERLTAARSELKRLETEAEDLGARANRNRLELYDSHGKIDQLTSSLAQGEEAATRLESERDQLASEISVSAEALNAARLRVDQCETELADLRRGASAAHDRRGQIEVERARALAEAEHLGKTCLSELAMTLEDVVTSVELAGGLGRPPEAGDQPDEISGDHVGDSVLEDGQPPVQATAASQMQTVSPTPSTIDDARAQLEELRARLEDIGPVNMMALEELEESETRFKFLSSQRADILESIRMTEQALAEIKRRSRERFRQAFAFINQNFQNMFVELFGGGRGEMILIDEEDVFESGIDLIAQPPGKRLQNVLLLSGGEKAMAAIALVLAIFQYRPSPFCILDEVDAPLDEVNVGRFSDKVIEMSSETQFLVITHNKRTMEAARALYGVTMEEPGVSKLVSVKFE
jgi:chromosome segregation protein